MKWSHKRNCSDEDFIFSHSIPEPNSGCWLWLGPYAGGGEYGMVIRTSKGPAIRAHRFSYATFVGPVPSDLLICHRCDQPSCVNPDHLFLGTHKDNSDDKIRKGRVQYKAGESNGRAKLTTSDVIAIRADTRSHTKLGEIYGISRVTVAHIRIRKLWNHI